MPDKLYPILQGEQEFNRPDTIFLQKRTHWMKCLRQKFFYLRTILDEKNTSGQRLDTFMNAALYKQTLSLKCLDHASAQVRLILSLLPVTCSHFNVRSLFLGK
ncbi:hypothetical protein ABEB36_011053 [Hypothenemus hampei]|uniref:Uncharacterized protein n=1 Tax=Hypothenemus hampei TaxID=57062 RepID=A0ABD1EE10_HYPHA